MTHIYLFTGNGGGKTTNALGLALRSIGHGHNVLIVQFLKWDRDTGENKFKHENYKIIQCGREGWHGVENLNIEDKSLAEQGLFHAGVHVDLIKNLRLVVLDEVNLAVHYGLLTEDAVFRFLDYAQNHSKNINIVMTGRHASDKLMDRADFVIHVADIKHPKEMVCGEGIQY